MPYFGAVEESIYAIVLKMHALAGGLALFVAPLAMLVKKGDKWHRIWGKVYVWSMVGVVITVLFASWFRYNPFMILIGIFSLYLVLNGYRALYMKKLSQGQCAGRMDMLLHGIAGVVNFGLLIWSFATIMHGGFSAMRIVLLVFGSIGSLFVFLNVRKFFKRRMHKQDWWFTHMGGMLGGYIATLTAFSVVNFGFIPDEFEIVKWLWPSIVGTPVIIIWIGHYRKKFEGGKNPKRYANLKLGK